MDLQSEPIFQWLSQYAYQPEIVYLAVMMFMIASGFGLPIPEEVTIVSVGILAFMGAHPDIFPPPYPGAKGVQGYDAAIVTLCAVIFSDLLVFNIGRRFGRKIINHPRFSPLFSPARIDVINNWIHKYGNFAVFIFRFTPGVRFPAHIILGMSQLPAKRFIGIDGLAALLSVPTQILLIYHFGEPILQAIQRFKFVIFAGLGILLLFLVLRKFVLPRLKRQCS